MSDLDLEAKSGLIDNHQQMLSHREKEINTRR